MSSVQAIRSIFDLEPLEVGGIEARQGFGFQDHVAAAFCLDMYTDDTLLEVWCETQDDVTLIWNKGDCVCVEFVQAKSSALDQLWSLALLYERKEKRTGTSIVERSLAYDRCLEPVSFRLVTARDVNHELRLLRNPPESIERIKQTSTIDKLAAKFNVHLGNARSANGHDCAFWLRNLFWEVRSDEESVQAYNLLKTAKVIELIGAYLVVDQQQEVYNRLLGKVSQAAKADHALRERKRIKQQDFRAWFGRVVDRAIHPAAHGADTTIRQKMQAADLPADMIQSALEERRLYRQERLRPRYLSAIEQELSYGEVVACLQRLRSRLDKGELPDAGCLFHDKCLEELETVRESLPSSQRPPLCFLHGCMYDITGRCLHRFRRAAP